MTPMKRKGALRTGALLLIVGCFAVSAAIRAKEAMQDMDFSAPEAAAAKQKETAELARIALEDAAIRMGAIETASTSDQETPAFAETEPMAKSDMVSGSGASGGIEMGDMNETLAPASPKGKFSALGGDSNEDDAARLLAILRRREAELTARATELREREIAVAAAAKLIDARLVELERAKEEFAALVDSVDQAAEQDVEHLVEMYSKMKPKVAGPLFSAMDPSFAAGFLGRMRADRASEILSKMSADAAYAVSLEMAGRNVPRRRAAQFTPENMSNAATEAEAAMQADSQQ